MPHFAAFHLDLHCLPNYLFTEGQRNNVNCTNLQQILKIVDLKKLPKVEGIINFNLDTYWKQLKTSDISKAWKVLSFNSKHSPQFKKYP